MIGEGHSIQKGEFSSMYEIITLGSNTVDIFAHTDRSNLIEIHSKDKDLDFISYPVGGKLLITKLINNFGGNGANSAVCFSRLGFRTGYLGKVGRDQNGKLIIEHLKKEKISFIGTRGEESGLSIILDAMEEDRTILVYKGCNNEFKPRELDKNKLKTKWFYISSMLGDSLKMMEEVVDYARSKKIKIAFNPSATLLENETQSALKIIRSAQVLVLNKEEAETLVGCNPPEVNVMKLRDLGPSIVSITDGKNGAVGYKDGYYY
jgi:ribokinase